jgi:hypothetical protein
MTPTPGSMAKARKVVPPCSCAPAYKDRNMTAPDCAWCDHGEDVAILLDAERAEALWHRGVEHDDLHDYGDCGGQPGRCARVIAAARAEALEEAARLSDRCANVAILPTDSKMYVQGWQDAGAETALRIRALAAKPREEGA